MNDTFRIATPAILKTNGEIYQYVGDEIVISWTTKKGVHKANCLQCHYDIVQLLKKEFQYFEKTYGVQPQFKSGLHFGSVIAGEIGVIKKEIVYSGDVLNTAARIQSLCNEMQTDILVSKDLIEQVDISPLQKQQKSLGEIHLRGKQTQVKLITLI